LSIGYHAAIPNNDPLATNQNPGPKGKKNGSARLKTPLLDYESGIICSRYREIFRTSFLLTFRKEVRRHFFPSLAQTWPPDQLQWIVS
jgi:hypothetical protein